MNLNPFHLNFAAKLSKTWGSPLTSEPIIGSEFLIHGKLLTTNITSSRDHVNGSFLGGGS